MGGKGDMWKRVPGTDGGKGTKGPWYGGKEREIWGKGSLVWGEGPGTKGPWYGKWRYGGNGGMGGRGRRVPEK